MYNLKWNFTGKLIVIVSTLIAIIGFHVPVAPAAESDTSETTIVDEWATVTPPAPPELKAVSIEDAKNTALLILDMQQNTCNPEQRPRCVASVAKVKTLLYAAREHGMPVIYSLTPNAKSEDIIADLQPNADDPIVKSSVDKFYNTDLDSILKDRGVTSVIVVGTVANGAVLHTATAAAVRGYQVMVPVDGMSSDNLYAEQYTAWHMVNSPGARNRTTLTKISLIQFQTAD